MFQNNARLPGLHHRRLDAPGWGARPKPTVNHGSAACTDQPMHLNCAVGAEAAVNGAPCISKTRCLSAVGCEPWSVPRHARAARLDPVEALRYE